MSPAELSRQLNGWPPRMRLAAAHGLYGAGLLALSARPGEASLPWRVLGVRHILQGLLVARLRWATPRLSGTVDAVHGASMLALARLTASPPRRRAALLSAGAGGGLAAYALAIGRGR